MKTKTKRKHSPIKAAPEIVQGANPDNQSLESTPEQREPRPYMPGGITGKGFKPGQSGNPNGRPRDVLKEIGMRIAKARSGKVMTKKEKRVAAALGIDPEVITLAEKLMLELATSKNAYKNEMFLKRTFGDVPSVNINVQINSEIVSRFKSKFTDAELEDIASMQRTALDILFDKLPDVNDENVIELEATNVSMENSNAGAGSQ